MRRQVSNELAVTVLAQALKNLDKYGPEEGMGLNWNGAIDDALLRLGLSDQDIDYGAVLYSV